MENKDKVALVTGGLTGIGKAAVMELAKKGYTIIISVVLMQRLPL